MVCPVCPVYFTLFRNFYFTLFLCVCVSVFANCLLVTFFLKKHVNARLSW